MSTLAALPPVSLAGPVSLGSPVVLTVGALAVFVGIAGIVVLGAAALPAPRRDAGVRRLLSIYTLAGRPSVERVPDTALGRSVLTRSVVALAGRVAVGRVLHDGLARKLDAAGLRLQPAEWIVVHAVIAVAAPALLFLLTGGSALRATAGLVIGAAAPYLYLGVAERRRVAGFVEALPDTLQLLAGSLEAGYSLPQAVETVARESEGIVGAEFGRALVAARLGVPVEETLDAVAERMQSRDFSWVVMAVRIQREVGGNLAEILKNVAQTLRERDRLRRQVQVLSAEGRLSGWILAGLPVGFLAYLLLVRPDYLMPMFTDPLGVTLLGLGAALMAVGVLWIRRIVDIEI